MEFSLDKQHKGCKHKNMMSPVSAVHRAMGMLVIIFLLGGLCWLDTLDLTDDIQFSYLVTFGQQGVEPEELRDDFLSLVSTARVVWWASPVVSPLQSESYARAGFPSLQYDRPLYQSLCNYRI